MTEYRVRGYFGMNDMRESEDLNVVTLYTLNGIHATQKKFSVLKWLHVITEKHVVKRWNDCVGID